MGDEEIDPTVCKQMSGLVELLTTSGKSSLNQEVMKKFKRICRQSDSHVKQAYEILMKQLHVKHSEVRLSVSQMVDELFQRSHVFRELILDDLNLYMELTAGLDKTKPLPPPKPVAKAMKEGVFRDVYLWHEKFASGYKKLSLGFEFLKTCKKVDFDVIKANIETEQQQKAETERKLEEIRLDKLRQVEQEISDRETDIQLCMTEIQNGLELLLPKPEDFFIPVDEETDASQNTLDNSNNINRNSICSNSDGLLVKQKCESVDSAKIIDNKEDKAAKSKYENGNSSQCADSCTKGGNKQTSSNADTDKRDDDGADDDVQNGDDDEEDSDDPSDSEMQTESSYMPERASVGPGFTQEHGMLSHQYNLTINVDINQTGVTETEDNADIIQDVRDKYRLIKHKFLPKVKKWVQVLNEARGEASLLSRLTDLQDKLETALRKCLDLDLTARKRAGLEEEESDSDFEDVPEKEGYEEEVPEHVLLEAASTSDSKPKKKRQSKKKAKELAYDWLEYGYGAGQADGTSGHQSDVSVSTSKSGSSSQVLSTSTSRSAKSNATTPEICSQSRKQSKHRDNSSYCQYLEKSAGRSQSNDRKTSETVPYKSDTSSCKNKSQEQRIKQEPPENDDIPSNSQKVNQECSEPESTAETNTSQMARVKNELDIAAGTSGDSLGKTEGRKDKLLKEAPVVKFGSDLEHWENRDKLKPAVKVRYDDASRFWVADKTGDQETDGAYGTEEVASLTRRAVTYIGKLEPIKWKCRAPLHNGTLCERMDRKKCPFHGTIVGRDKTGQISDPDDVDKLARERIKRQIEEGFSDSDSGNDQAKGDSKGRGKGKKKGKKRKYPNLTDIKEKETSRDRLEAKIFNRSTMKKVNAALDAATMKKLGEKFGNQFNYSLK